MKTAMVLERFLPPTSPRSPPRVIQTGNRSSVISIPNTIWTTALAAHMIYLSLSPAPKRRPQMESHLPYRRQSQRGRPKERRVHPRKFKKQVSMINSCPPPRACAKRGAGRNKRSPRSVSVSHLTHVRVTVNDGRTYQAPTKKELLEARRETARMRSDMRVSISTDATRSLDIKTLLERFDVSSVSLYILRCRVGTHVEPLQKATRTRGATTAATLVGF